MAEINAISVQHNSESIASISKYRLHLDKNKNRLAGAISVIVNISDDSKVHLTHQSAKEFLLNSYRLTDAEFCRGLEPNLYLAEVCMLFFLFPGSETDPTHEGHMGFLRYAAWNWYRHIEKELDGISRLDELICRVTEPKSLACLRRARVTGLVASLENAEGVWDIAMGANINWLGDFKGVTTKLTSVKQIADISKRGEAGYGPFLALVQRAKVKFTDNAVYEMVRLFDQPMVRVYHDSHGSLPKTQALYIAAVRIKNEHALPVLRYLLEMLQGTDDPKLLVDRRFAQFLIRYTAEWTYQNLFQ
ncbi:hypothetical protein F4679DRAFT_590552 [Xylaria curta]|nr:hypothetical protein F4679DRAFT_590552 [Xylaria curta]